MKQERETPKKSEGETKRMKIQHVSAWVITTILRLLGKSQIPQATPNGMRKMMAVDPPLPEDRATRPRNLMDFSVTPVPETTGVIAKCGHEITALKATITYGEEKCEIAVDIEGEGQVGFCLECWAKAIRHCAWCGYPILPGSPITLCYPEEMELSPIDGVSGYEPEPGRYVGCMRWECARSGGDRAGFLQPDGTIRRVESIFEAVMRTGKVVVCSDLTKDELHVISG